MTFLRRSLLLAVWICRSGFLGLAQRSGERFHWHSHKWQKEGLGYDADWDFPATPGGQYHTGKEPHLTPTICEIR